MAYTTQNTRTFDVFSILQRLADLRAQVAERTAKYRLYRATLDELAMLSDRDLADLGISRSDIRTIGFEATYAK